MDYTNIYPICATLQCINIIANTFGLYLLACLENMGKMDVQLLLVANLSVTEVLLNVCFVVLFSCYIDNENLNADSSSTSVLMDYTDMFSGSVIKFVYYATMVYLTLNKLLEVVLNLTYQNYCTKFRGKILLSFTWMIGFVFFLILIPFYEPPTNRLKNSGINNSLDAEYVGKLQAEKSIYNIIFNYFYTVFDIGFLFFALFTHGYLFHLYRKSKLDPMRKISLSCRRNCRIESWWIVFRKSRFYISFLLITTFIFMVVLPKVIYFFIFDYIADKLLQTVLAMFIAFFYYFSFLVDAVIYIFLHPHLKRLFWKKLLNVPVLSNYIYNDQWRREPMRMSMISSHN